MGYDLPAGVTAPMVGDEVLVRGTVKQWLPAVGARIEVLGKTDVQQVWVRPDQVAKVIVHDAPGEPGDGTWLGGFDPHSGNVRIFHRDDAHRPLEERDRRHSQRWWDVVAEEWVDWPTAVRRGADPKQIMRVDREALPDGQ